jgi:bifunctional DNA-binding transcriptional regulator/antitoxin component of YhaV-PrlF toxin-antitoxin module
MDNMLVKNKRLKMSPGGIVSLPVSARKTLGMEKRQEARVTVAVNDGAVLLAPASAGGFRVSAGGQLHLAQQARETLEKGTGRHYWLELNDSAHTVAMHPFT